MFGLASEDVVWRGGWRRWWGCDTRLTLSLSMGEMEEEETVGEEEEGEEKEGYHKGGYVKRRTPIKRRALRNSLDKTE
ncbi:hypothetical protein E2C01_077853 [Portunus trituberculatus]|uniref:Uncharacterized protein n=1 Tax=Portunus trituberculatus TaxID=210409 RepID=A0A5B7IN42_PORTR|nr:hypothetical protein [Portunus trituberculatus]